MKTKLPIILLQYLLISMSSNAKVHTIYMNIEGIKFDSIHLNMNVPGNLVLYNGETSNQINWTFEIPDSTFIEYYVNTFTCFETNQSGKPYKSVLIFNSDTLKSNAIFMNNSDSIPVNLMFSNKIPEGDFIVSNFSVESGTDPEVPLSLLFYRKYFDWAEGSLSYDEIINNYLNLVKKYPDSYALAKTVKMMIDWPQAEDAKRIYDLFSERIKATDQGQYLKNYIERKLHFKVFENIKLPNWETEKPEYIIQDTSKYCLVVFSASWCGPCHEQIPVLKEIYNELGSKLDIVYVSTDRKKTMAAWKDLMIKEKIPWRSVLSGYENGQVSIKYFVTTIPCTYLVHPDSSFEELDVRDKKIREKLRNEL
ncbi:TlpA family protein disulfide reductase [Saccharicrinis sp. FJH2]|uniref:TlpA family protein disulfide reductase n=1 Tax=Saccharicrinis sp. FJH65 TaxID=3344659 RepID=UPI0035F3B302